MICSAIVYAIIIAQMPIEVQEDCVAVYHGEVLKASGKRKAIDYEKVTQYREGKLKTSILHGVECHFGILEDVQ